MIKSISLLVRKDGLTHAQFVRHWVEVHAPLAHAVPGLKRYVQLHIVEERRRADIPAIDAEIDGIATATLLADGPRAQRSASESAAVALHGHGESCLGEELFFQWTSDCPGASFDDPTAEDPVPARKPGRQPLVRCLTPTQGHGDYVAASRRSPRAGRRPERARRAA